MGIKLGTSESIVQCATTMAKLTRDKIASHSLRLTCLELAILLAIALKSYLPKQPTLLGRVWCNLDSLSYRAPNQKRLCWNKMSQPWMTHHLFTLVMIQSSWPRKLFNFAKRHSEILKHHRLIGTTEISPEGAKVVKEFKKRFEKFPKTNWKKF